ncbi:MAG: MarR family winged helix-turn-helix transcriptional regulator [Candidatus Limnocylindrales bacterium]
MKPTDWRLLGALDRLAVAMVGITTLALAPEPGTGDLSLAQWRTLTIVSTSPGLRSSEVASLIGMSRPSMSRLVRLLRARGILTVAPDPRDGRATILRPTAVGEALREQTLDRRRALISAAIVGNLRAVPDDLLLGLMALAEALEPAQPTRQPTG